MNLAQAVHYVYHILRANKVTETFPSYADVIDYLNEGQRKLYEDCASRGVPIEYSTVSISTVASTATYAVLSNLTNLMTWQIIRVVYRDTSSDPYLPLQYKSKTMLYSSGSDPDDTTYSTGVPQYWYFNDDASAIGLYPIPDKSSSSGLKVFFAVKPTNLSRYWGTPVTTSLTASVTNASTAVTLSATGTGNAVATDEIGVISSETAMPTAWYTASAVSGTSVTLSAAYAGATNATAKFVTGQAFTLGNYFPAQAWAIVYFAAGMILQDQDPERASKYYDEGSPGTRYGVKFSDLVVKLQERNKSRSFLP